ncbi:MAG: hypothetical protein R3C61_21780 [Bacteroidia bacterium]
MIRLASHPVFFSLLLLIFFCPFDVYGQNNAPRWGISAGGGFGAGWWIFDKGYADSLPDWHLGYDRTHLSLMPETNLQILYRNQKVSIALGAGFSSLLDRIMISSADRRRTGTRYVIASGNSIPFLRLFLSGSYYLPATPRLDLVPTISAGSFFVKTIHPQKPFFRYRFYYEPGISYIFHLSDDWEFAATPRYSHMIITTRPEANRGARHHIHTMGINIAFRIWIR